jgi:serine/threonine protein kinase/tetratricopeptide (TPR) repeat protein
MALFACLSEQASRRAVCNALIAFVHLNEAFTMPEYDAARVIELFEALVDLPPAQQQALLSQACADDPELLAELRGLLAADQRVGAMTARPIADELATMLLAAAPESSFSRLRVGAFEVREELGHGGMGVVYRAERVNGSVEQQVAIKFVRRELLNSEMRARFAFERQTLAAMDHPNIARLIDAAELDDGSPYYVMEYVQGLPITEYCERERLGLRERVALFRTVCDAVAYAHRNLVVHRDLKPGNVLVNANGVPKLLDFGIAKLLLADGVPDAAEQTATGQRYFSPLYAAPEQLLGQPISVGCDVYALGLLLCECLTGARAFDFANLSPGHIERLITSVPPAPPSQIAARQGAPQPVQRQLRGDLDGIVLRCLRKSVHERYDSVEQLAADLDNYLQGRPVQARGGHVWYRTRKFVRRNWVPVSTGSVAVLALIGGVVAFATQARIAEQRAAELEQVSAFQARMLETLDPAAAGVSLSDKVLADYVAALESIGVSESERSDLLSKFEVEWQRLNTTDLARQFVDDTLIKPAIVAVEEEFDDQPLVAAQLNQGLAQTYLKLGIHRAALPLFQKALMLNQSSVGEDHARTLITMYWLGKTHYDLQESSEALSQLRPALDGLRRVLGNDDEMTITVISALSSTLTQTGEFVESEQLIQEALDLEAQRRSDWEQGEISIETIDAVQRLGLYLLRQERPAEAEPYLRKALDARERTLGENHPTTHGTISQMIVSLIHQGNFVEAERYSTEMVKRALTVYGRKHPQTSIHFNNHGVILTRLGRLDESEDYLRRAFEIRKEVHGPSHPETLYVRSGLGVTIQKQGRLADAESLYTDTLQLARNSLGNDHPETLIAVQNLASLRLDQQRPSDALELLIPAESATRQKFGTGTSAAKYLLYFGQARSQVGEFVEAERLLLEAHSLFASLSDSERVEVSRTAIMDLYEKWQLAEPSIDLNQRAAGWRTSAQAKASSVSD